MKKTFLKSIFFLLCCVFVTGLKADDGIVKILAIGNSFSVDAVEEYLDDLAAADGTKMIIGNLSVGGRSLQAHANAASKDLGEYTYRKINLQTGEDISDSEKKILEVLKSEDWDFISVQQVSNLSGMPDTFKPYLSNLVGYLRQHATNSNVKIILHQTWAYASTSTHTGFANYSNDQMTMYEAIIEATTNAAQEAGIDIIIPSGTAIQNGRTSEIGDNFCRDGYHLNYTVGRYTAAMTWYQKLTGKSILTNTFRPDKVTLTQANICKEAVLKAIESPYRVTYLSETGRTPVDHCLIKVANTDSVGPLNLHSLVGDVLGAAYISSTEGADIFVMSSSSYPDLCIYEYKGRDANGTPIFGGRIPIEIPSNMKQDLQPSHLLQTADKIVHLVWHNGGNIYHATYDKDKKKFIQDKSTSMSPAPIALGGYYGSDDRLHMILGRYGVSGAGSPNDGLSVYDGAGIFRGKISYSGLYESYFTGWINGSPSSQRLVSPTNKDLFSHMRTIRPLNLKNPASPPKGDIIFGSSYGGIYYCENIGTESIPQYGEARHIVGTDGKVLQHPAIAPRPTPYPNANGDYSDLIVSCEGGIYFYKFTGNFTAEGAPIFEDPVEALEKGANLCGGTLVVPTVVDWDGDGVLDIVSGTSQGFIYFFKNVGNDVDFKFLPAQKIEAGNEIIFTQGGYNESVQSPTESRWGYTSPNVIDWNEDGHLDILMGDARSRHSIFRGNVAGLADEKSIYMKDLELHGRWRCRPGIAKMGDRMAYITLDDDNEFHLYWKVDDYNLEDGGKLLLTTGEKISAERNSKETTDTGRLKFDITDWDGDGVKDLIIGTSGYTSIPNKTNGVPYNSGHAREATVVYMKNSGSNESPVYEFPVALTYDGNPLTFYWHECGAVATTLGGTTDGKPNILVGDERGRYYLLKREHLSNTDTKFKGINVEVVSNEAFTARPVSTGIKIYKDADYTFNDANKSFNGNRFFQIYSKKANSYTVIAKTDGPIYIATNASYLPLGQAEGWTKIMNHGFGYNDGSQTLDYSVFIRSAKKGEIVEIPQAGFGTIILSSGLTEGCLPDEDIQGTIISLSPVNTKTTIGNPSLLSVYPGEYIVAYNEISASATKAVIATSADEGESWVRQLELTAYGKNPSLFSKGSMVYMLSNSMTNNNLIVSKSEDMGKTWSLTGPGIVASDGITASTPLIRANGRYWKTVKSSTGELFFVSVDETLDPASRTNWESSSAIAVSSILPNGATDLQYGTTLLTPDNKVVGLWSVQNAVNDNLSIAIQVSADGKTVSLYESGLNIPGGQKQYTARYDDTTKKYWALTNPVINQSSVSASETKNGLLLTYSENLLTWIHVDTVFYHTDAAKHGFHSSNWMFDGNDILSVTCVSSTDCTGTPMSGSASNYLIFHRVKNVKNDFIGIEEIHSLTEKFNIYPNPAHDRITLQDKENTGKTVLYKIYNLAGSSVDSGEFLDTKTIEISNYPRGIYFLEIVDEGVFKVIFN